LNDKREKRVDVRYGVSDYEDRDLFEDVSIEIDIDNPFKPEIADISLNGIGFSVKESEIQTDIDEFSKLTDYFIKIYMPENLILTEVRKRWSTIIDEDGTRILKCGCAFSVMSSKDRLVLAEFIKTIRNKE
jgi:hypothetical protein